MFGRKKFFRPNKYCVVRVLTLFLLGTTGLFTLFPHKDKTNELVLSPWTEPTNCHETVSWKIKPIDNWTLEEMFNYVKWTNRSACTLAHDFGGVAVLSFGIDGQKTICLDESVRPERTASGWPVPFIIDSAECLVYSFGINNEWSFDEAMEGFGCRVFSFDPSMNIGQHNHSKKIHFYSLGLNDRDEMLYNKKFNNITGNWTTMSLDSIYRNLLQHEGRIIDYLKIDIEESEWTVLPQIISSGMMDNVRQLGVEVHLFPDEDFCELNEIRKRVKIIQSLEDYGLVRFDSKYNPWAKGWRIIDNHEWEGYLAYEIAWYNSRIVRDLSSIDY